MAVDGAAETLQIHRIPHSKYIDAVRWLPPLSAFDRFVVLAVFDSDSCTNSLEIQTLNRSNPSVLTPQSSFALPSRVSSLRVSHTLHKPLIAASTFSGSLQFLFANSMDASLESDLLVPEKALHVGPISCIDLQENGSECVSVGEDGRVNLVSMGDSTLNYQKIFDSKGLVSYTAAKWASPTEFATGGLGFSLQWWDQRKPGEPVSQFKGNWDQGTSSGIVHSIDIHPSRKHTCLPHDCGYFMWYDPPMQPRAIQVIPDLLRKLRALKNEAQNIRHKHRIYLIIIWVSLILLLWNFFGIISMQEDA